MTLKTIETVLASAVANAGTVTLAYPAGTTVADFVGRNAAADGKVVVNGNEVYNEATAGVRINLSYGASNITLTNNTGQTWAAGSALIVELGQANKLVVEGVPAAAAANVGDVTAALAQSLTATAAVTPGVRSVELNHASVVIAATIADARAHQGLFIVKDTSASGTAAHTLTLTSGTFDGTNTVATLNAPNEALVVWFDSAGNGTIVENIGAVALS